MLDNRQTKIEELKKSYEHYLQCKEEIEVVEYIFPTMEETNGRKDE